MSITPQFTTKGDALLRRPETTVTSEKGWGDIAPGANVETEPRSLHSGV